MINTMTKNNLERKGFTLSHSIQSNMKVSQGRNSGKNLEVRSHGGVLLTSLLSLCSYVTQDHHPKWARPSHINQSRKCLTNSPIGQPYLYIFPDEEFLFSNDSSSCQIAIKLTNMPALPIPVMASQERCVSITGLLFKLKTPTGYT